MVMKEKTWNLKRKAVLFIAVFLLSVCAFREADTVWAVQVSATPQEPQIRFKDAVVNMTPATTKKLKLVGAKGKIKWSSSKKKVAAVNSAGKVTAKAKGTAKIRAVCKNTTYVCTVVVTYGTYKASDGIIYKDAKGSFGSSGRWFKKKVSGGKYSFTNTDGSAVYFKVTGSKYVNVNFVSNTQRGTPYFAYSIDGGKMKRQQINNKKISVGNTKTHYVRLVIDATSEYENRWGAEAGAGIKSIKPVAKDGVVTAVKPQNPIIAFYGDSITKGVRTLGMGTPSGTSTVNSYSWHCAQKLKMTPYFAGFGAAGIVERGTADKCINVLGRFSASRKASSFTAEVVVLEYGTNDVYTHGNMFISEYVAVLNQVHKMHPKAKVMVMIPLNQIHADEIRFSASPYKKWCTVIETSPLKLSYTDGIHPTASASKKMGKYLAQQILAKRKK